ncbi:MAG: winged helix DNA-binding domain-containing protein [Frankiaceae bacterium]
MRSFGPGQRRARLAVRHALTPAATARSPIEVARRLVALHSTDAASVYLSVCSRMPGATVAEVENALYEQRTLVRMLGMRRTVFVLPVELAPIVHAACTEAIAARERRKLVQYLEEGGVARDGARWLAAVEAETRDALAARGQATAAELASDVAGLREQLNFGAGKKWAGSVGVSTRVLFLLAADGVIVRGRPRGSWLSTQYHWAPMHAWLPGGLPSLPVAQTRAELVRRWLAAYGPGTPADIAWWTGWTAGEVKQALAQVRTCEVNLGAGTGLLLDDDDDAGGDLETAPPETAPPRTAPWAALLPALDPTVMGWAGRDWFLGQHRSALFDRSGNAGPTVWWDGRVVGGWAQRRDGEIAVRLLEDVGADAWAAICGAATRLQGWLGPMRVTPRFRTPLERELSA